MQDLVLENHVSMITIAEVVYPVVVLIKHVLSVVLERFVPLLGTAHLMNFVVNWVLLVTVLDLVLESRVKSIPTADHMNIVAFLTEHAPQIVLENCVRQVTSAHQVNLVVPVIQVLAVNVQDLVLENCVRIIITAEEIYLVVNLLVHVPQIALESLVSLTETARGVSHVVVIIEIVLANALNLV